MKQNLKRTPPAIAAAIFFAIMFMGMLWFDSAVQKEHQTKIKMNVLQEASYIRAILESEINAFVYRTSSLQTYTSNNPDISQSDFMDFAQDIVRDQPGIISIQLAHNSIISHVYPRKGSEKILGLNLLELPAQSEIVKSTIKSGKKTLAGPVNLVQGGAAFICRTPVYAEREDGSHPGPYWGFVTILISRDYIISRVRASMRNSDVKIGIRGRDGKGAKGEVFFGDAGVFNKQPIILDINIPNGKWQIGAAPEGDWNARRPGTWIFRTIWLLFSAGVGALIFLLIKSRINLSEKIFELRASEERIRDFLDNASDKVMIMSPGGEILYANKATYDTLEYDMAGDALRMKPLADIVSPGHRAEFSRLWSELTQSGGSKIIEINFVNSRNQEIIVSARLNCKLNGGEVVSVRGIFRNITQRKQAERERDILIEKLRKHNKEMETFTFAVSHELKAPLVSIEGIANILEEDFPEQLEGEAMGYLDRIKSVVSKMRSLIQVILDFAKSSSELTNVDEISFYSIMADVKEMYSNKIMSGGIDFSIKGNNKKFSGNEIEMFMAFSNLVGNAIKYMGEDAERPMIEVGFEEGEENVFYVKDNGAGIEPDDLDKIFEPFSRVRKTANIEGSGLGLATVRRVIEKHGGRIWVESECGKGSTFYFTIASCQD